MWSEMGKQNVQAKEVCCASKLMPHLTEKFLHLPSSALFIWVSYYKKNREFPCICFVSSNLLNLSFIDIVHACRLGKWAEKVACPPFSSSESYFFVKIYKNFIIL